MAPPKKMTLQEFFTDESFGGSWADDDIDIASISVPIERHNQRNHYGDSFSGGNGFNQGYGSGYGNGRSGGISDNGPPYIVKLVNLPITCDNSFVEDLFKSRYTPYVKFKIVVDPSSNILETNIIKKVAFVELVSQLDVNKALKWTDLYYKPTKKVIIELADFNDFQDCMAFNSQHEDDIKRIEEEFRAGKHQHNIHQRPHNDHINSRSPTTATPVLQKPSLRRDSINQKDRPNPFGSARPVDVLAKQHEIEKKLIAVNHTTIKTPGALEAEANQARSQKKTNFGIEGRRYSSSHRPHDAIGKDNDHASQNNNPPPKSVYESSSLSLAQLLSAKSEDGLSSTISKKSPTPSKATGAKPSNIKPVILKKKVQTSPFSVTPSLSADVQGNNDGYLASHESSTTQDENKSDAVEKEVKAGKKVKEVLEKRNPTNDIKVSTLKNGENREEDNSGKLGKGSKSVKPGLTEAEEVKNFKKHLNNLSRKSQNSRRRSNRNQNGSKEPSHPTQRGRGSFNDLEDGPAKQSEADSTRKSEPRQDERTSRDSKSFSAKHKHRGKPFQPRKSHSKDSTRVPEAPADTNGNSKIEITSSVHGKKHSDITEPKKTDSDAFQRKAPTQTDKKGELATLKKEEDFTNSVASNGSSSVEMVPSTSDHQNEQNKNTGKVTTKANEASEQSQSSKGKSNSFSRGQFRSGRGNFRHRGRGGGRGGMNYNLSYVRHKTGNDDQPSTQPDET